jgi:CheY-like chemotaxis protein
VSEIVTPPDETSRSRRTVLVADDDGAVRKTAADILNRAGYDVLQAADGEEALRALRQTVDVLLLDMHLPKREGLSVLDALGSSPPMVIVCSAFAFYRPEDIERVGLGARVFRCLRKPIPPVGLVSAVADAIHELDQDN